MSDGLFDDLTLDDLTEEFARRWRTGERPSIEEYVARFPQWAAEIRDLFPGVVLMEQLKPRREEPPSTMILPREVGGRPPDRLGDYRILRELGRGGMGVVYEAEHEALGRRVAIKVLPAHLFRDEKMRSRFQREAQAAARLHHTNIVPVFAVGAQDGCCFYVMQLISGHHLDREPTAARVSHDLVARIGVQVADALAYAHTQGVLHRDIKPSNLLLDDQGAVWVTDFGVAKLVEEANLTQSGELVGTLKYMPPERFLGQSDVRGDVYSLGITLYEMLAGRSAFPDTTPQHLIQLITHEELPRLRKADPTIPADLETIVLKAVARDPAHRYQTAAQLADDLRRFLDDRPILARRAGPAERFWRWCRRNRMVASLTTAVFLLLAITAVVSMVAFERERKQREQVEKTFASALEAFNHIYNRFAPSRIVVTPQVSAEGTGEEGIDLPVQPVLSPEAVPLLEELLGFYEQVATQGSDYPKLQSQAAEASQRIGDIRQRLGQFEQAISAYRKAIELYARPAVSASDEAIRIKLARTCNELGRVLLALQQVEEASSAHTQALAALTEAPTKLAVRPECRYELARTYYFQAQRDFLLGPPGPKPDRGPKSDRGRGPDGPGRPGPGGPDDFGRDRPPKRGDRNDMPPRGPGDGHPSQRAGALLETLVKENPSVPEYRHLLACCYRDAPPDRGNNQRAVDLLRQLVKDFPKTPDYRHDLCETLAHVGFLDRPLPADALPAIRKNLEEAVDIANKLADDYPTVPQYRAALAGAHDKLGLALHQLKIPEAEKEHRRAIALQTELVKQHRDVIAYDFSLALMQSSLGRLLSDCGEASEARTLLETAANRLDALLTRNPRLGFVRMFLGRSYRDLAQVLGRLGEKDLAAQALRKAETFGPGPRPEPSGPRERREREPR